MTSIRFSRFAFAPLSLFALLVTGAARADESELLFGEPGVRVDNCPFDVRHPHAMRCLSSRLVPESYARAQKIGPFTDPPDAGAGADASIDISTCNGKIASGGSSTPGGLVPSAYNKAYNIPSAALAPGKIVAIVDACAETTVVADLAAYRKQFNLPALPQCGAANGHAPTPGGPPCFGVVSQRGDGVLPTPDDGWAGEIALDVEMASVGCPECSILLVEADTPNSWDLGPAVAQAIALGASAVSNSYGAVEDPNDPYGAAYSDGPYASYYQHDGVLMAVASGDGAYNNQGQTGTSAGNLNASGASFPSTVPSVLSVGGTELKASATAARGYTEVVWPGSTSACSAEFAKPPYQSGLDTGSCTMRADVDVAAPGSNVSTYLGGGWHTVGGTSCASPFVAALFTHLGVAAAPNAFFYANPGAFFDINADGGAGGNNDPGNTCHDVMCNTGTGWDGPTGLGTPNGAVIAMLDAGAVAPTDGGMGGGPDATLANDASAGGDAASADGAGSVVPLVDGSPGMAGDGGNGNGATGGSSGCGCVTAGASSASSLSGGLALVGAVAAAFGIRRRRTVAARARA
jgi:MYXO-CTERM domain-containing protein